MKRWMLMLCLLLFPFSGYADTQTAGLALSQSGVELLEHVRDVLPRRMVDCLTKHRVDTVLTRVERRHDGRGETVAVFLPRALVIACGRAPLHWYDAGRQGKTLDPSVFGLGPRYDRQRLYLQLFIDMNNLNPNVSWRNVPLNQGLVIPVGNFASGGWTAYIAHAAQASSPDAAQAAPVQAHHAVPEAVTNALLDDAVFHGISLADGAVRTKTLSNTGAQVVYVRVPAAQVKRGAGVMDFFRSGVQGRYLKAKDCGLVRKPAATAYLALFVSENPQMVVTERKSATDVVVDWSKTKHGDWWIPVMTEAQTVQAHSNIGPPMAAR